MSGVIVEAGDKFVTPQETHVNSAEKRMELGSARLADVFINHKDPVELFDAISLRMARAIDDLEDIDLTGTHASSDDSDDSSDMGINKFLYLAADTEGKLIAKRVAALKTLADMAEYKKDVEAQVNESHEILAEKLLRHFLTELNKSMNDMLMDELQQQALMRSLMHKFSSWSEIKAVIDKAEKAA